MPQCGPIGRQAWHQLDNQPVGPLLTAAPAPRLSLQEQAPPLQQRLMASQPSSLRTSFRALCITRIKIKESVIYDGKPEGGLDPKSSRIPTHAWTFLRLFPFDDFCLRKAFS